MALVGDLVMRFSKLRGAPRAPPRKNVSRRVIKPVAVLVFTEDHIFIPMHDFDTPVRRVESQLVRPEHLCPAAILSTCSL